MRNTAAGGWAGLGWCLVSALVSVSDVTAVLYCCPMFHVVIIIPPFSCGEKAWFIAMQRIIIFKNFQSLLSRLYYV